MLSSTVFMTIHVFLRILMFLPLIFAAGDLPSPLYCFCFNETTFTPQSPYQTNLKDLLRNLSTQASLGQNFYQISVGDDGSQVYGSYLCRGDLTEQDGVCKDCVAAASEQVTEGFCSIAKEVLIWYDKCMLRYSNRSFFNIMEEEPAVLMSNLANVTEPEHFRQVLQNILDEFASEAEHGAKSFLKKEVKFTGNLYINGLMQCTPDLSGADCTECLRQAIAKLTVFAEGKQGGRVLKPSCNVRFDTSDKISAKTPVPIESPPPPPSPPTPPPLSNNYVPGKSRRISRLTVAAIVIAVIVVSMMLGCCLLQYRGRERNKKCAVPRQENETADSLQYDLITIETATNKFSEEYKLGKGGFGEVYKGILANGQEIAVKRLSKSSGQGEEEFKNEVALVAKLQHRNLVRLLGFCLEGEETILVYEFVPNKSLDFFLFDFEKYGQLNWSICCKITCGIARGLLYLHEDSRLRVIHRDLKASNVLLDGDMNPKISDFGMARMFGIDQTQANTNRIVGTYGYMAPEYAMEGLYSVKSDVFSFGVLLLEIVSGKKNSSFHLIGSASSLLAHAWRLWNEGKALELMDQSLKNYCPPNEYMRYVHIGLLCVQEDANNRPTMSSVIQMLTTETMSLPKPERPAFSVGKITTNDHYQDVGIDGCSDNGLTISVFGPR